MNKIKVWLELCNYLNITKKSVVKLLNHVLKNKNFNSFLFLFYQLFRKITSVYNFDELKEKLIFYNDMLEKIDIKKY